MRIWVSWVIAAAAIVIVARNPLYSLTMLLVVGVVARLCAAPNTMSAVPIVRLGALILVFSILFNGLSIHIGNTVMFRLPTRLPVIGGPITLEAAAFGLGVGVVLLALLTLFSTFNKIVPTSELVRLTPRALRDLGVVILIAVTYIPETSRQLQRIREAQAIRGHRIRGFKDWRPILIPLLVGGLERAMGLAESMVSRGFGATANIHQPLTVQILLVAGLLFALVGWVFTFWVNWLGWLLLAAGVVVVTLLLVRLGRSTPYTRYRPRKWTRADTIVLAVIALSLFLVFVPLPFVNRTTLTYVPFPALSLPGFDPVIGLALILLVAPALQWSAK